VSATGRALARAGLIVSGAFLVSRVLGWVRLVVIGNVFGVSAELDALFAAFRLPDLIFQLVAAGALSSALIPVISSVMVSDGGRARGG
jgi:putative peptidoglycan lipid II flippase